MQRIGLGSQGGSDLRRRPRKTIYRWQASLIPNWCSAPSRISRCITARLCFFVKWRKCRIRRFAEILATPTENVMSHLPRVRKYVRESLLSASRLCGLDSSQ